MKRSTAADAKGAQSRSLRALLVATNGSVPAEYVSVLTFIALITLTLLFVVAELQVPAYSSLRDSLNQPYP